MTDDNVTEEPTADPLKELEDRCDQLERELLHVRQRADSSIIKAHLKAEATRVGMIDLDGLKMLDLSKVSVTEEGEVQGVTALMERTRKEKPWLFGKPSSSNPGAAPPSQPPRQKLATEMTDSEYKTAREAIIRYRP